MNYKPTLELLGVIFTVTTAYLGVLWLILRPHYYKSVLRALASESAAYKHWNDALYADWREEQVATQELAKRTYETLVRVEREMVEHRAEIAAALNGLAEMPRALQGVADAVRSLEKTVVRLDMDNRNHEVELAILRDREKRSHPPHTHGDAG